MIDIHTHILPELDDGAESEDDALAMCRMAAEDGIDVMVATPHMFCDVGNPTKKEIAASCDRLRLMLVNAGIEIDLHFAAEVAMLEELSDKIKCGEVPMLDRMSRFVLLEAPRTGNCSRELSEMVFQLQLNDITPVVAHPECTESFYYDPDLAERVVRQGAFLQVTAGSFLHGGDRFDVVMDFLKKGLIHVVASDAHDRKFRPPLLSEARRICADIAGVASAENLFCINPARILQGEDPLPLEPIEDLEEGKAGFRSCFRRLLQKDRSS